MATVLQTPASFPDICSLLRQEFLCQLWSPELLMIDALVLRLLPEWQTFRYTPKGQPKL